MVTAKFDVQSVTEHAWTQTYKGEQVHPRTVKLCAVYGEGAENKSWSEATPSGSIEMLVTNPAAFEQFKLGAKVLISFDFEAFTPKAQ